MLRSTTLRFALLVFALQLVGAGAMVATVRHLTRGEIAAQAEDAARELRDELVGLWRSGGKAAVRAGVERRLFTDRVPLSVILLTDARGRFVTGNIAEWPPNVPAPGAATIEIFRIGHSQPERMRVLATRLPDGSRLLAGHVVESELRVALAMEEAMAVGMAAAIALAALAAWIAARMIERRLEDTVATAHAVAAGDLSRRVAPTGGDDAFDALARAVNGMLDRIALLMTELKVATDGLAHDLRSPLTRLRATLDRAWPRAMTRPRGSRSAARWTKATGCWRCSTPRCGSAGPRRGSAATPLSTPIWPRWCATSPTCSSRWPRIAA